MPCGDVEWSVGQQGSRDLTVRRVAVLRGREDTLEVLWSVGPEVTEVRPRAFEPARGTVSRLLLRIGAATARGRARALGCGWFALRRRR